MGTQYLLDSNVIIGFLDNRLPNNGMMFVSEIVDSVPNISVISKIEVLRYNITESAMRILEDFISCSNIRELDTKTVNETIKLGRQSKIKLPDAIIAATCLINKYVLLTRNVKDFDHITDLKIINPWEL
jgi:predicted nucleic acid-binding protein